MKLAVGLVLLAVLAGSVALFSAYAIQRRVLFPAPALPPLSARGDVEIVSLAIPGGSVEAIFLPSAGPMPAPLLMFAHGNGEVADDWIDEFAAPRAWGWSVLLLEYPGYGRSGGSPSETTIVAAAEAALRWARRDPRVEGHRIVAYGRSLGGGVAARLAAEHALPALILESAFTSVRPLAARFFLPGFLVRDPFDTLAALARFHGPLLVLHGRDDTIVPPAHGRALAAAVPGAVFHELPCGHNDCPRSWPFIARFLQQVT
jgi:pimeloyl-ACP methyl ester carboxylesterase